MFESLQKYVFDIQDPTMTGHEFKLSTTQDGTHTTGGTGALSTGVTYTGTAGTDGTTVLTVSASTPCII